METKDLIVKFNNFSDEELKNRFEELNGKLTHMVVTDIKGIADELDAIDFVLRERKKKDHDDGEAK